MTGNNEGASPTPLKLNFIYNPQRAVLTNNVVNFIRHYAGAFYPTVGRDTITGFRRLMQVISNSQNCLANTTNSYEFSHVGDTRTKRFTLQESFKYEGLSLSVVPANNERRTEIAALQANQEQQNSLTDPKTICVYITDELRSDSEMWAETKACTGVPAVEFFDHLKEFLSGPGKKLNIQSFQISKSAKHGVNLEMTLLIPRVTAYYLRVQCKFS